MPSPPPHSCYFISRNPPGEKTSEILVRIEEALKFLNIAHLSHGNIPVSQAIDEIWHYWILETQEYAKLCELLPTGAFLHHRSNAFANCEPGSSGGLDNDLEEDVAMLANYVLNFGPYEKDRTRHWLLASRLVNMGDMTVDQLNDWLLSGTTI